jgi:autotransporter-associated beta strand protein
MLEKYQGGWGALFGVGLLLGILSPLDAQPYEPGTTYFGRSNYIEYIAGDLPFILSAPHGGTLQPAELPLRTYGTFATDSNTEDLARRVRTEIQNRVGHVPHIIICRLDRDKIDANREIVEGAQGHPLTEIAWNEFQNFISSARTNITARHGRGFYIDLHGHGHSIPRLELGYLLSGSELRLSDLTLNSVFYENQSSIRALSQFSPLTFPQLLRGETSFGGLIAAQGYPAVPGPDDPAPGVDDDYFNGGYNTVAHGSRDGGTIDGLQIESNSSGVRDSAANRTAFAQALACALEEYFATHYQVSLRECLPSVWPVGGGSWDTAANWRRNLVPVSTNHLVFAGPGGAVTHNLSALTTGTGVVGALNFSNAVSGAYTISGNPFSVLRGLTNQSSFTHVINNAMTTLGSPTISALIGALTFGGGIIIPTGSLRIMGDVNASSVISGAGGITKVGAGQLALTAVNFYGGPTTNSAGTISLNATATFGDGAGLLVLSGGEILARNTRSGAPIANPILMTGSSTISGNGTLTNSLRILPFSANDISATAGTLTIRNSGGNPFASNNVFRVRLTGGGFSFPRPVSIGFLGDLEAASSQLESYNDLAAGDQIFPASISGPGQFRRSAADSATAGRTILSGANSYSGGTIVTAGTLLVNNPFASGTGPGFVAVSNNGTLGGSGVIAGPVAIAGTLAPGQSVGTLAFADGLDLSAGGTNVWELAELTTAGAGVNFDQTVLTGGELNLGPDAKLQLSFINSANAPNPADPFWLTSHTWEIISLTAPATNSGSASFGSIVNGHYATGSFTNYAAANGSIILAYVAAPAPEPVVETFAVDANGAVVLSYAAQTNRTCVLQYATSLNTPNWISISTNIVPAGSLTLTNLTEGDPMRFYRVLVVP